MIRLLLLCCLAALLPTAVLGQTIRGRVVDAGTGGPIPDVALLLVDLDGTAHARTVSDSAGAFFLSTRQPGAYRIEARHVAYENVRTDTLHFSGRAQADVVLRMATTVIPLDPLTVTARGRDERHYATYRGLFARREASPSVGPTRVVLRSDPEMRAAIRVADILQWFTGTGCITVYWNGTMIISREITQWMLADMSAYDLEGLEYYKRDMDAPLEMRQRRLDCQPALVATTVALWARLPEGYDIDVPAPEPPPTLPATPALAATVTTAPDAASGRVAGTLRAGAGYVLEGAVVELVGPRGERFGAVRAEADGTFTLDAPGPGTYHLRVLHRELGAMTSAAFELPAGHRADVVLRLGGV